jgi:hypothetical protein
MSAFTDLSNNKIGDSTGDKTGLWFFVGHFLLTYSFYLKSVSESVGDPFRLFGFESSPRFFTLFSKFPDLQTLPHCTLYIACGKIQFSRPGFLLQCGISTPYLFLACGNS